MLNTTLTLLSSRNKFSTKYMFKSKQIKIHKAYFKKKKRKKKAFNKPANHNPVQKKPKLTF